MYQNFQVSCHKLTAPGGTTHPSPFFLLLYTLIIIIAILLFFITSDQFILLPLHINSHYRYHSPVKMLLHICFWVRPSCCC
ncbi:hypothetical protein VIGAN_04409600 [Vigna angularis var. angularis]|uniref:Uncharacterized protein n=1 Tax=Vigna angularis var. angularis TaxID=157739 RepID=A0A0S3S0U0_PHAAN|nr:hypothetical protein VIGAN_04409600 [Vigna angularis var. angularis]